MTSIPRAAVCIRSSFSLISLAICLEKTVESAVPCHSNRTTRINFACFITALCSRRSKIGEPWFQPRGIWRSIRSLSSSRCRHHGPRHAAPHQPAGASVQSCLGPTCPIAKLAARHGAFCDLRQNHREAAAPRALAGVTDCEAFPYQWQHNPAATCCGAV